MAKVTVVKKKYRIKGGDFVLTALVAALVVFGSDAGGFLDLRGMATVVITIYCVLSLVAILAGYYLYHLKHLSQQPDECPFSGE